MRIVVLALCAWALAACAAEEQDGPQAANGVEGLKQCVRDEVNEARGAAHDSVLGDLAVAHCADEIYRTALSERGGRTDERVQTMDRARQLEAEMRAFALRYALGLEG